MKITKRAFTLVEVLVTITIFSIMMISVMGVYMTSTSITYKADLNRFMQENVKNIVTNLSEDIMKYKTLGVIDTLSAAPGTFKEPDSISPVVNGFQLKLQKNGSIYTYKLATYDKVSDSYLAANLTDCKPSGTGLRPHCFIIVNDGSKDYPISNDLVTVEDLQFYVTGTGNEPNKVTTYLTLAIAPRSGVREGLIKETKLRTQFTITVRDYMSKN